MMKRKRILARGPMTRFYEIYMVAFIQIFVLFITLLITTGKSHAIVAMSISVATALYQ